jgi:hypothetical protein
MMEQTYMKESCKEGCGSKRVVLSVIVLMDTVQSYYDLKIFHLIIRPTKLETAH